MSHTINEKKMYRNVDAEFKFEVPTEDLEALLNLDKSRYERGLRRCNVKILLTAKDMNETYMINMRLA